MIVICERADECQDQTCPHAQPHEPGPDCEHTCDMVADARCVVDVAGLPEIGETGTVAVMVWRKAA